MDQDRVETVQPKTLSTLEEDFDHPPPLEEGEATACQGAMVFDNYSNPSTHVTQGLVEGSDWSGRFGQRKGKKPLSPSNKVHHCGRTKLNYTGSSTRVLS
jgi:hypothetical protein